MKLETLGKTHEGRKIVLVKISPEGNEDKNSNIVWMDGGRKVIIELTDIFNNIN